MSKMERDNLARMKAASLGAIGFGKTTATEILALRLEQTNGHVAIIGESELSEGVNVDEKTTVMFNTFAPEPKKITNPYANLPQLTKTIKG